MNKILCIIYKHIFDYNKFYYTFVYLFLKTHVTLSWNW